MRPARFSTLAPRLFISYYTELNLSGHKFSVGPSCILSGQLGNTEMPMLDQKKSKGRDKIIHRDA